MGTAMQLREISRERVQSVGLREGLFWVRRVWERVKNRSDRKTDRKTVRKTSPSPTEKPSDILVRYFLRTLSMAYEKRIELPNVSLSA